MSHPKKSDAASSKVINIAGKQLKHLMLGKKVAHDGVNHIFDSESGSKPIQLSTDDRIWTLRSTDAVASAHLSPLNCYRPEFVPLRRR